MAAAQARSTWKRYSAEGRLTKVTLQAAARQGAARQGGDPANGTSSRRNLEPEAGTRRAVTQLCPFSVGLLRSHGGSD